MDTNCKSTMTEESSGRGGFQEVIRLRHMRRHKMKCEKIVAAFTNKYGASSRFTMRAERNLARARGFPSRLLGSDSEDDDDADNLVMFRRLAEIKACKQSSHKMRAESQLAKSAICSESESEDDEDYAESMCQLLAKRHEEQAQAQAQKQPDSGAAGGNNPKEWNDNNESKCSHSSATFSEDGMDYDVIPKVPEELDQHEHRVYKSLVEWKFRYNNETGREPYNTITQKRTLCELVRMRRNNPRFALRSELSDGAAEDDLLSSVWNIGSRKTSEDGAAWKMLDVLDSDSNNRHLKRSRNVRQPIPKEITCNH